MGCLEVTGAVIAIGIDKVGRVEKAIGTMRYNGNWIVCQNKILDVSQKKLQCHTGYCSYTNRLIYTLHVAFETKSQYELWDNILIRFDQSWDSWYEK